MLAGARPLRSYTARHASFDPRQDAAGQARLHHGRHRRDRDLSPARRAIQPHRAAFPPSRAAAGRPYRPVPREQPALLRDLLGRAALGPDLHRDQLAAHRGRGRVHRERLRREAVRHLRRACRQGGRDRGADAGRERRAMRSAAPSTATTPGRTRSPPSPRPASPTRPRATTCSIRRAPRAGRRACCRWSSRSRSTPTTRCCRSPASATAWTSRRSTSRRRRSIMRLPCAST